MTWHSLPLFVRLAGRPVILIGDGEAADAKRRLLDRAGATIVGEQESAMFAIVALDDPEATVVRLKARGILVNAVDRPDLCDFTLPAIVDRHPVLVAIGTGGASAGLAAGLRQRLEQLLPSSLGRLAQALDTARAALRARFPDAGQRRRAIAESLAPDALLDPLRDYMGQEVLPLIAGSSSSDRLEQFVLHSTDVEDLTLRQARLLATADRLFHHANVPAAIVNRARADAPRIVCAAPPGEDFPGLSVYMEMA